MIIGTISTIFRYPVKSLMGETLQAGSITTRGLAGDRAYALIDGATGKIASAKQPNLWKDLLRYSAALIEGRLQVTSPDGATLSNDPAAISRLFSQSFAKRLSLVDQRDEGISLNRARPDEVMEQGEGAEVTQDLLPIGAAAPDGGFFDFAPLHIITSASMAAIEGAAHKPVDAKRYRPNIMIETASQDAFAENGWLDRSLQVGSAVISVIAPTPRCAVPMLAQNGEPSLKEAVSCVNRLNRVEFAPLGPGLFPCLGAYARVVQPGEIRTGDRVILLN